jgi:hypothetical protein
MTAPIFVASTSTRPKPGTTMENLPFSSIIRIRYKRNSWLLNHRLRSCVRKLVKLTHDK